MSRVLYFAYGSNMDSSTLRGRRGVEWTRACPALARGWRLAVDKPSLLGTGEAMATLVADAGAETWGVLFEISAEDYEHLALTEGVLIGHYLRTDILVTPAAARPAAFAGPTTALAFTSETRDPSSRPSRRYMALLLAGAAEHGLPEAWIESLGAVETAEETETARALGAVRDAAMAQRKP